MWIQIFMKDEFEDVVNNWFISLPLKSIIPHHSSHYHHQNHQPSYSSSPLQKARWAFQISAASQAIDTAARVLVLRLSLWVWLAQGPELEQWQFDHWLFQEPISRAAAIPLYHSGLCPVWGHGLFVWWLPSSCSSSCEAPWGSPPHPSVPAAVTPGHAQCWNVLSCIIKHYISLFKKGKRKRRKKKKKKKRYFHQRTARGVFNIFLDRACFSFFTSSGEIMKIFLQDFLKYFYLDKKAWFC